LCSASEASGSCFWLFRIGSRGARRQRSTALRRAHREPLATLHAYVACMADLASTPDALSRNLAYLQIDLTDEDFRAHLLTNARATRREIESLLRSAVVVGQLQKNVYPRRLARTIEAVISESLMSWACYREGPPITWIRQDLDAVLLPHLAHNRDARPSTSDREAISQQPITPRGRPGTKSAR
jgi:hypothetical protein